MTAQGYESQWKDNLLILTIGGSWFDNFVIVDWRAICIKNLALMTRFTFSEQKMKLKFQWKYTAYKSKILCWLFCWLMISSNHALSLSRTFNALLQHYERISQSIRQSWRNINDRKFRDSILRKIRYKHCDTKLWWWKLEEIHLNH